MVKTFNVSQVIFPSDTLGIEHWDVKIHRRILIYEELRIYIFNYGMGKEKKDEMIIIKNGKTKKKYTLSYIMIQQIYILGRDGLWWNLMTINKRNYNRRLRKLAFGCFDMLTNGQLQQSCGLTDTTNDHSSRPSVLLPHTNDDS